MKSRGLGGLARERPIVAHGGHHLNDGRAGRLRVAPIVQQRCVRRPLHDTVDAVGRESGQLVLQLEPTGPCSPALTTASGLFPRLPGCASGRCLGGGAKLSAVVLTCRVEGLSASICARCCCGNSGGAGSSLDNKRTTPSRASREATANICLVVRSYPVLPVGG